MSGRIHINNFETTLDGAVADTDTSIDILSATGLPTLGSGEYYLLTISNAAGDYEMIKVTARTANALTTTVRGQEGTAAQAWLSGDTISCNFTALSVDDKQNKIANDTDVIDFGAAASFEIPNSASPTVNAEGEIALDTTITGHKGLIKYYTGSTEMVVISCPTANLTTTDNYVLTYDDATDSFDFSAMTGGGISDGDYGQVVVSGGGTVWNLDDNLVFPGSSGNVLSQGSTASRGSATFGKIRFNTSTGGFEAGDGGDWNIVLQKPTTSAANAVQIQDGTNGYKLKDSGVLIDTSNNVTGALSYAASSYIKVGGNSTAAGYIELLEDSDNGTNKITLTAPASISSDKIITLPDTAGTVALVKAAQYINVNRSSTQTITTATNTKLQLNTEVTDTDGTYDSATNYRHTPTTAGYYLYVASASLSGLGADKAIGVKIYKTGAANTEAKFITPISASVWLQVADIIYMNGSTDYVEVYLNHDHGSDLNTQAFASVNYLRGYLLS